MNPFETLGLPERFDLTAEDIESAYLTLAAETHPDRFPDPIEQAEAAERSSMINQARATLLDPESRARALLSIRAADVTVDEQKLPDGLLMEVMEVRETIEASAGDPQKLASIHRWADQTRETHLNTIASLFNEFSPGDTKTAQTIRVELNALRYIQRMLEQMPS